MRKIWILAIPLILVGALFGSDALFTFGMKHNPNLKISYVTMNRFSPEILYLGPCEAEWEMDPEKIDPLTGMKSFNLAESHSDFADNYLHLYLYLKHNPAPKYLFLYVTGESIDSRFNTFNTFEFAAFLKDSTVASVVRENDPAYSKWTWIPFLRYAYYNRNTLFNALDGWACFAVGKHLPSKGVDGFMQPYMPVWANHVRDFLELYPRGTRFVWDSLRMKYLVRLIDLTRQNHIRLFFYESPIWNPSIPYIRNRYEVMDQIRQIGKRFQVPYLVFDTLQMSNDQRNFVSNLYTSRRGGLIFNPVFARYFNQYIKDQPYPGLP